GFPTGGELKVWDVATGQKSVSLQVQAPGFSCAVISPDGKRLAAGSFIKDQQTKRVQQVEIKVWSLAQAEEVLTLKGHTGSIFCMAFSPDSKHLASSSGDSTVKVWDITASQQLYSFKGQGPVAFSPDGRRLASMAEDGAARLWDLDKGQEALALKSLGAKLA